MARGSIVTKTSASSRPARLLAASAPAVDGPSFLATGSSHAAVDAERAERAVVVAVVAAVVAAVVVVILFALFGPTRSLRSSTPSRARGESVHCESVRGASVR